MRVFWERYGDGDPTLLLVPPWSIYHSRVWKAQIPYLARHFRVVAFDPRGNGRSDRPRRPRQYAEAEFAGDALAVLDATATERAVVVSLSLGAQRGLLLAADHPERVLAAAFVAPWFPVSPLRGLRWRVMAHPMGDRAAADPAPAGGRVDALQRRAVARGLRRLRRLVGARAATSPRRTRPSRSRTRWGGRSRPMRSP